MQSVLLSSLRSQGQHSVLLKSYLNPCVIRGLIAVLKTGAVHEGGLVPGGAVFAEVKCNPDNNTSIKG